MARVAIEAFLNNGARIGDVCRFGWWTVKDGWIADFKTEKTGKIVNWKIRPMIGRRDGCTWGSFRMATSR
jgi:hypothetical protein